MRKAVLEIAMAAVDYSTFLTMGCVPDMHHTGLIACVLAVTMPTPVAPLVHELEWTGAFFKMLIDALCDCVLLC